MGHGVEKDFAYANQLEDLLGAFVNRNSSHQIINAGVQGYNTEQEYHMLSEALYLQPDFAIVGFCYNYLRLDESLQTYKHDEVRGYDPWLRYLLTETGFGLSIQKFRQCRFSSRAATISEDTGRLRRSILRDPVRRSLVTNRLNDDMGKIYAISRENDVDAILLILPAMEQLFRPELQAFHADLTDFAKRNNARSVDLTAVFEQSIAARVNRILSDYQSALQTGLALQALGNANMAVVDVYERALYTSQHAGERSRLHYMIGKARTALGQRQVAITHLRHAAINLQTSSWPAADPQRIPPVWIGLAADRSTQRSDYRFRKKPDNKSRQQERLYRIGTRILPDWQFRIRHRCIFPCQTRGIDVHNRV